MRLIDADALKKQFGYTDEWHKSRTVTAVIDNAPTVERPHGEWIESKERKGHFYCSEHVQTDPETGKWRELFDYKYPFCPNCGADMRQKTCGNCYYFSKVTVPCCEQDKEPTIETEKACDRWEEGEAE